MAPLRKLFAEKTKGEGGGEVTFGICRVYGRQCQRLVNRKKSNELEILEKVQIFRLWPPPDCAAVNEK